MTYESMFTVEEFLKHLRETKSKNTYLAYDQAIRKFSEFYGKTPNEILEERKRDWVSGDLHQKKRFAREIERFHKWLLEKGYTINSATTLATNFCALFTFYEMPITDLPSEVVQKVPTTKDFVPTREQYQAIFRIADNLRDKLIISMGLNLAWRIGDFAKIRKDMLPDLEQDAPILFELITEKEKVIAKSFLAQETVDLLKEYMPIVQNNPNPYLFPSNTEGYFTEESINRTLKDLAEKASIKIPKNKRLRFHAFRKRFLAECANASIDVNTAKVLCGKDVEDSMLAYLSEVEHREAFIKVHDRLKLTETATRKTTMATTELEKKVDMLEKLVHLMIGLGGRDLITKALELLPKEEREGLMLPVNEVIPEEEKEEQSVHVLEEVAKKLEKKRREEYRKLIESNNNNNNH
jgi:integrase